MSGNSYFSHDSNARNSDKLLPLRMNMSVDGYGIYFMILERLREEPDYMSVKDYNMLAFDFRVGSDKVKSVIENFGLFSFTDDGKRFYSESFMRRMNKKDEKTVKARESANIRWENEKVKCERNANASKIDAIKEKESKVKRNKKGLEKNPPPLIPEIVKPPIPKNPKQPDALQFPFCSQKFIEAWEKLIQMPKWKKKLPMSLQMSLDKLAKYDEDFSIELIGRAIAGDYQGITFSNTDEDFLKWKTSKGKTGKILQPVESRKQTLIEKFEANAN